MSQFTKNLAVWAMIIFTLVGFMNLFQHANKETIEDVSYTRFMAMVDKGLLTSVELKNNDLTAYKSTGEKVKSLAPNDPDLIRNLREKNVNIQVKKEDTTPTFFQVILSWAPWILFIGIWVYFMRQMQGGGGAGKAFSFGKSRAQLVPEDKIRVTFKDVAGVNEAKEELQEVVDFLKDPGRFQKLGGRLPKGALLVGPPGTGKTLLARAVAGEAKVPFYSISGSDFVEMFVGVGAARVRDLFEQGKKNAPCIIFIAEIDAVGRHRGAGLGGGNDEREQTLNAMLVEMDGFESNEGVIILAATNRPDVLDPALLRPGRFDRQVTVPLPDIKGREQILNVHIKKIAAAVDVDVKTIARGTPGFSGADLENLVNESALMAARKNKRLVDTEDFEKAKDKIMMGAERKSAVMTHDQYKTTAYHEAGHAICTMFIDGPADPLHKVTIIPRGRALGVTMSLPVEDKVTYDKAYIENQIAILYGGRLAEELILDQMTTGASNDIERATDLAHKMVCNWGMSKLGPIQYGQNESEVFLGRDIGQRKSMAEQTAREVDEEVRAIIDTGYKRSKALLKKNNKKLHQLAKALLEYETLDSTQIKDLFAGKKIKLVSRSQRTKKETKPPVKKKTTKKSSQKNA